VFLEKVGRERQPQYSDGSIQTWHHLAVDTYSPQRMVQTAQSLETSQLKLGVELHSCLT